jgi:hypothetical protein
MMNDEQHNGDIELTAASDAEDALLPGAIAAPRRTAAASSHRSSRRTVLQRRLLYAWVAPLLSKARRGTVQLRDLPPLQREDTGTYIDVTFTTHWHTQLNGRGKGGVSKRTGKRREAKTPSLFWGLAAAFGKPLSSVVSLLVLHNALLLLCLALVQRCLTQLLQQQQHSNDAKQHIGSSMSIAASVLWALVIGGVQMGQALCRCRYLFTCQRVGMRLRAAATVAVQHKVSHIYDAIVMLVLNYMTKSAHRCGATVNSTDAHMKHS